MSTQFHRVIGAQTKDLNAMKVLAAVQERIIEGRINKDPKIHEHLRIECNPSVGICIRTGTLSSGTFSMRYEYCGEGLYALTVTNKLGEGRYLQRFINELMAMMRRGLQEWTDPKTGRKSFTAFGLEPDYATRDKRRLQWKHDANQKKATTKLERSERREYSLG